MGAHLRHDINLVFHALRKEVEIAEVRQKEWISLEELREKGKRRNGIRVRNRLREKERKASRKERRLKSIGKEGQKEGNNSSFL